MKRIVFLLALLAGNAYADELVINQGQSETLYEGTLHFIDLDGVNGDVQFDVIGQPLTSGHDPMHVPSYGAWTIELGVAGKGRRTVSTATCYPTFGYTANHGSRLVLDCVL